MTDHTGDGPRGVPPILEREPARRSRRSGRRSTSRVTAAGPEEG